MLPRLWVKTSRILSESYTKMTLLLCRSGCSLFYIMLSNFNHSANSSERLLCFPAPLNFNWEIIELWKFQHMFYIPFAICGASHFPQYLAFVCSLMLFFWLSIFFSLHALFFSYRITLHSCIHLLLPNLTQSISWI